MIPYILVEGEGCVRVVLTKTHPISSNLRATVTTNLRLQQPRRYQTDARVDTRGPPQALRRSPVTVAASLWTVSCG